MTNQDKPAARIPLRRDVDVNDTWDLSSLFPDAAAWNAGLGAYEKMAEAIPAFRGTLGASPEALAAYLDFARDLGILEERLAFYSELREVEDQGDGERQTLKGRFVMAAAKIQAALAWAVPEIQTIPGLDMDRFLPHPRLEEYRIYLKKILRYKPHILSGSEERLLAIYEEGDGLANEAFSVLTNVDMDFGSVETPEGTFPISQSTWAVFMQKNDRGIRERAYRAFYKGFASHKTTLAALYSGSVKKDVIKARVRGFPSARAAALFPDNVDESVYDNLIAVVSANMEPLHRYYALRKRLLKLDVLRHYDVYVPLLKEAAMKTSWNEAVDMVSEALSPLGDEYVGTLRAGLLGRWADRYENKGKRSGAFSSGGYTGAPYILMNYKEDSVRDVFTLAHEGGHSMHTWYSVRANPYPHYNYTIFEAEVASTFNEELLYRHLVKNVSGAFRTCLVNKRVDDILATLYRQTMFAEFEKRSHELEEAGAPLTADLLRAEYRKLLEKYFGPSVIFEEESDLEVLRIPHFYHAFYVYKYATGISASLALAERVLSGGAKEREDYFAFLKSGGSRFPLESLKAAGVDMGDPAPVEAACKVFAGLVGELERLL
ncbi:MAG: oligoendopeptidase F [Treponema sp.]|jgi:oligoendopeptidase F|nr:oligoendopeptidase F [Treponema sp.]